jgi:hypothetical protein
VFVVDFGEFEAAPGGFEARAGTGAVWHLRLCDL